MLSDNIFLHTNPCVFALNWCNYFSSSYAYFKQLLDSLVFGYLSTEVNKYLDGALGGILSTAELGKKPCCNYTIAGFYPAKAYLLSEASDFI